MTHTPDTSALAADAVDEFDLAAKLEMNGHGHSAAQQAGFATTIAWAQQSMTTAAIPTTAGTQQNWRHHAAQQLTGSAQRVAIMVCGVALCFLSLPIGVSGMQIFAAGTAGWLVGQMVSAAAWCGLSTGRRAQVVPNAALAIAVGGVVAVLLSWLMGTTAVLLWTTWACAAAVLTVLRQCWSTAIVVMASAAVSLAARLLYGHQPGAAVAAACIVAVALVALMELVKLRDGSSASLRAMVPAVAAGLTQTVGLVAVLLSILLVTSPSTHTGIALGGLAAGALSDPVLTLTMVLTWRAVNTTTSWRRGLIATSTLAVSCVLAVTVLVCTVTVAVNGNATLSAALTAVIATTAISSLTVGTGILLRVGSAQGAAWLALSGALFIVPVSLVGHLTNHTDLGAALVAGAAAIVMSAAVAVRSLARPTSWLH